MVAAACTVVAVVMGVTLAVEVVMLMRMGMVMAVGVGVLMGVGMTVVGMLVGMAVAVLMVMSADMIMVKMHKDLSFSFFSYYNSNISGCQRFYFFPLSPMGACEICQNGV